MQSNYLTEKINTYRKGVLMGNYIEQKYSDDAEEMKIKNQYFPETEFQSSFRYTQ